VMLRRFLFFAAAGYLYAAFKDANRPRVDGVTAVAHKTAEEKANCQACTPRAPREPRMVPEDNSSPFDDWDMTELLG
jgi:hypothetical protein